MRQELFRIFGIPVYGYGTLVLIGVLTGLWLLSRNARRRGWNPQVAQDCAVYLVIGGLLGGRTFHFIQYHDTYESPLQFFALWKGGLVLYGALLGGLGMGLFLAFRRGLPVLAFLDLLAPSVTVGIAFGRLGCLMNGCCWGRECHPDFPLGLTFPVNSPPALDWATSLVVDGRVVGSVPLQPTQIYASINAFLLTWVLWRLSRPRPDADSKRLQKEDLALRKSLKSVPDAQQKARLVEEYIALQKQKREVLTLAKSGLVIGSAALLYGCSRFLLEGIRGDHHPAPGAWTVSQWISTAMVVTGVLLVLRPTRGGGESQQEHSLARFAADAG